MFCHKRGLIGPEQRRLWLACRSFLHSTSRNKALICGFVLSGRWTVAITIMAWRSWALMSSSWQPDNIRMLPCLPASSVASLPTGRTLHFHFVCSRCKVGRTWMTHRLFLFHAIAVVSFHTEEVPLHTSPANVADSAKKFNKLNYVLNHLLSFGWQAIHLFIKCWRLSFTVLQPQIIL